MVLSTRSDPMNMQCTHKKVSQRFILITEKKYEEKSSNSSNTMMLIMKLWINHEIDRVIIACIYITVKRWTKICLYYSFKSFNHHYFKLWCVFCFLSLLHRELTKGKRIDWCALRILFLLLHLSWRYCALLMEKIHTTRVWI